jgi:hypothetical protein
LLPGPSLRHLKTLSGPFGLFEHARFAKPRLEHGYCTDDAGRALALACRLPEDPYAEELAHLSLSFLERAHISDGQFRLREAADGKWTADPPSDDASGRALFGLGTAAALSPWEEVRERSARLFKAASGFRSPWSRATAYAALGAVELLAADPSDRPARLLAQDSAGHSQFSRGEARLDGARNAPEWRWPEPRLTYANGLLPEAALALGVALGREDLVQRGLSLLIWLAGRESFAGHWSFTPVSGRGPGGHKPAFDQQPIEAWAMADASARAFAITGDPRWAGAVLLSAGWFSGYNDLGVQMWDPVTGGAFDGLTRRGPNRNQGAESTLAMAGTALQARIVVEALRFARRDGGRQVGQAERAASK